MNFVFNPDTSGLTDKLKKEIQDFISKIRTSGGINTINTGGPFSSALGFYFEGAVYSNLISCAASDPDVASANGGFSTQSLNALQELYTAKTKLRARSDFSAFYDAQIQNAELSAARAAKELWATLGPQLKAEIKAAGGGSGTFGIAPIGGSSAFGDIGIAAGKNLIIIECKFYTLNPKAPDDIKYFTLTDAGGHFGTQYWEYLAARPDIFWRASFGKPDSTETWVGKAISAFPDYSYAVGGGSDLSLLQFIMSKGGLVSQLTNTRYIVSGGKQGFFEGGLYYDKFKQNFQVNVSGLNVAVIGNIVDPSNENIYKGVQSRWSGATGTFYSGGKRIASWSIEPKDIKENSVYANYLNDGKGWVTHFSASINAAWAHSL